MRQVARVVQRFLIAAVLLLAPAGAFPLRAVEVTSLSVTSDPGDFIGQGIEATYEPPTARFSTITYETYSVAVDVYIPDSGEDWSLVFAPPDGQPLAPGTYQGATRWPFQSPSSPGLSVTGLGHGCNASIGWFEIIEVEYGPGTDVSAFRARFQQFCEYNVASIRGEVRYRADLHVELSAPTFLPVLAEQDLTFDVKGVALDGTQSTITTAALPQGATFVDHGDGHGTFDWTPALDQSGDYIITFSAQDTGGLGESTQTEISVGRTLRVPADFSSVQSAIDAAIPGSHVRVSPGTYRENIDFLGKALTVESEAGPETTILDGGGRKPVVTFSHLEGRTSVLSGFTIRNGWSDGGPVSRLDGGGISIDDSSPIILNNIVKDNRGQSGGGIHVDFGSPLIEGNTIAGNQGGGGVGTAGIFIGGAAKAEVVDNVIENNAAYYYGGGIGLWAAGTPRIERNVIRGNSAQQGGGIYMANYSDAEIVDNLIYGNRADAGGGVYWLVRRGYRGPRLVSNTIAANDAAEGSAVAADGFDTEAVLVDNLLVAKQGQVAFWCGEWDPGTPILSHNDVYSQGAAPYDATCAVMTGINSNISVDPAFACAETGDFRPLRGSQVIDVGFERIPDLPGQDFLGASRILDGDGDGFAIIDLGAYELDPQAPAPDACIYAFCPNDIQVDAPRGEDSAIVAFALPAAPGSATVACTPPPGSLFPEGTTTVACSATLASGQSARCAFAVTIFVRPLNDRIENATVIGSLPFTDRVDTQFATADGDPYCSSTNQAPAVWYSYTPTEDMVVTVDASGTDYGVQLSRFLFLGDFYYWVSLCGPGPDTFFLGAGKTLFFGARPVDKPGDLVFNVTGHIPLRLTMTIDPESSIDRRTGEAHISGTATCSRAAQVSISGRLASSDSSGPHVRPFSVAVSCSGTARWEAALPPSTGRVIVRTASVSVSSHADDPPTGESADASASLALTPKTMKHRRHGSS